MATTNLISKSLGNILTESGNGVPDHTSPRGSIYVDQDTGSIYKNTNGSTAWVGLSGIAYGECYYVNNISPTTIISGSTWYSVGNDFTEGENIAFTVSGDTMTLKSGFDGNYSVYANATLDYVAGSDNFGIGVSVNGVTPSDGSYNSGNVDATYTTDAIGVSFITSLNGGDTLELAVQNLDGTNNVIITHGQIFAKLMD